MTYSRRYVLKTGGLALAGLGFAPKFLVRAARQSKTAAGPKILIAIFQRGGADGLNMVIPHAERNYYALRPSIAIPRPSRASSHAAIDLDGFFGLHPAMMPFRKLYAESHLAVIHAVGSPDNTRSHFDAQDFMETATPGFKSTRDGWLNRHLRVTNRTRETPFRAVAMGPALTRSLAGPAPAVAMTNISEFDVRAGRQSDLVKRRLETMYAGDADELLGGVGRETLDAVEFLKRSNPRQYRPVPDAAYPRGRFGESLKQVAQLMKAGVGLEVACVDAGGWDHHVNEGGSAGQLSQRLRELTAGIGALYTDLGDRMEDVVIMTMSEFGRTVSENGNRGTDHGHATTMFVLGGSIRGGRVYGHWPGLEQEHLYEGRDLAVTTDFRDVFAEVLGRHLHCANLAEVFPRYPLSPERALGLIPVDG